MQFKSLAPRVAPSERSHQTGGLQRGRLTGCYTYTLSLYAEPDFVCVMC